MEQKIGPYRVEERLGVGGMGEVYKAYDDRLERWVAIKRIRGDKDEAEENRERFQREARATARLNHNSIVHLYDIFRDGDSDCIVMEYVEGVSLDTLVRNGPLEPAQVARLGQEIAQGLAEAHSKGIIHRDLKVENIIVTPEGHAKILDFGLARPLLSGDLDASLTGKGQLVGTSRAMSPEYVGGEAIDHRSDLFSLGVLIYEAVTSHSPFKAHNTLATLKQVMLHRQTPAHLVNSNVPEELSSIIERLLEKDPDARPQSAQQVADDFARISGQLSSGGIVRPELSSTFTTTPTEIFTPTPTSIDLRGHRRWVAASAALLFAAVIAAYALTRPWSGGSEDVLGQGMKSEGFVSKKDRVVLADFENRTDEPLLDDSLEIAFRVGLEQSQSAIILPQIRIQEALTRMERDPYSPVDRELGIEIGQREGARALIAGAIAKIGQTYSLSAEIIDIQSGVTTFATKADAKNQNAIVGALENITKEIRLNLGESLATIEKNRQPLEKVTTKNLEALKAYSLAVARIAEVRYEDAVRLLEQALKLDAEFAMAHAKLANVFIKLNHDRAATLRHLDNALKSADRLTTFERLYVEGWVATLVGDPEAAIRTWSVMSNMLPEEFAGHHNLGMAYRDYSGNYEEGATAFAAAARVATPQYRWQALDKLAYCQMALGRYDDALASVREIPRSGRRLPLADLYIIRQQYAEALPLIESSIGDPSPVQQINGRLQLTQYLAAQGRLAESFEVAREVEQLAREEGNEVLELVSQLSMITLKEALGSREDLLELLMPAIDAAKEMVEARRERVEPAPIPVLALIGKLSARNGEIGGAGTIFSLIAPLAHETPAAVWRGYVAMLDGEILAARGQTAQGLDRLKEASAFADLFQSHESLARIYEAAGLPEAAIAEYEWLIDHRGQGFVECLQQCDVMSVIDWPLAFYRLGGLHEQLGHSEEAADFYRMFVESWPEARDLPIGRDARSRLEALRESTGDSAALDPA